MNQAPRRRRWHPLLTVVILLFLSLTAWAVDQARQKVSPVSDKDYYRHGLAYNNGAEKPAAGQARSWSIAVHLDGTLLEVRLSGADGKPVTGAKGEVVLLGSHPGAMQRFDFLLTEGEPGQYLARLPKELAGQVMAQLTMEKGDASLHRSLLLNF
jgi:nitrogen fixation protein FixH